MASSELSGSSGIRLWAPGRQTKAFSIIFKGLVFILLTVLSFSAGLPFHANHVSSSAANQSNPTGADLGMQSPQQVGADPLPDLSLPKTMLSRVDSLTGSGGVVQASSQNLTLYSSAVALRLLGGLTPRDELLDIHHRILSHWSFWSVCQLPETLSGHASELSRLDGMHYEFHRYRS